jgi:hypothetical protein
MKIAVMVTTDDSEHIGIARDVFDEAKGYHHDALHKLYNKARRRLAVKLKKLEEQKDERVD